MTAMMASFQEKTELEKRSPNRVGQMKEAVAAQGVQELTAQGPPPKFKLFQLLSTHQNDTINTPQ
jgi:hypothetical protein